MTDRLPTANQLARDGLRLIDLAIKALGRQYDPESDPGDRFDPWPPLADQHLCAAVADLRAARDRLEQLRHATTEDRPPPPAGGTGHPAPRAAATASSPPEVAGIADPRSHTPSPVAVWPGVGPELMLGRTVYQAQPLAVGTAWIEHRRGRS